MVLPSVHALNYVVRVVTNVVTTDFCFHKHCSTRKVDNAIVEEPVRLHFSIWPATAAFSTRGMRQPTCHPRIDSWIWCWPALDGCIATNLSQRIFITDVCTPPICRNRSGVQRRLRIDKPFPASNVQLGERPGLEFLFRLFVHTGRLGQAGTDSSIDSTPPGRLRQRFRKSTSRRAASAMATARGFSMWAVAGTLGVEQSGKGSVSKAVVGL